MLLLTDLSGLASARADDGLEGVLVAVDARSARASLAAICDLLGGLALDTGQVRRWMAVRGGCALEGPTHWSLAAFADLERLPRSEQGRWCVWKSVELLYLLSAGGTADPPPGGMNPRHRPCRRRGEGLYVNAPRRAPDHPRAQPPLLRFGHCAEGGFPRALWPAHTLLAARKAHGRAAELLRRSDMSVLDISQAVGFASPSQFGANFLKRFGASPAKFRKMSVSGETTPETGGQDSGVPV